MNNKITMSLITCALLSTQLAAEQVLGNVEVISNPIITTELEATYATEVYTKEDILKSKSKTIYDFLSTQTSVNISTYFGNKFTQLIDLGGYGIGNGHQNVVITVDGKRLNNIDSAPQLLTSISISSIEKIEIIKGSGSVAYGDGATAGVINIITNGKNSNYIKTSYGSNGSKSGTLSLGYNTEDFIINGFIENTSSNGTRVDSSGDKDKNYSKNKGISLVYFPSDFLELRIGRTFLNTYVVYGGKLSEDVYENNINTASALNKNTIDAYSTNVGITYDINKDYSFDMNYFRDKKMSEFDSSFGVNVYNYKSNEINSKFNISKDNYNLVLGINSFNGERLVPKDITRKKNESVFVDFNYKISSNLSASLGGRKERVTYTYLPYSGENLESKESLNGFDLGLNYKINKNSSIFVNYNKSYVSPDLDAFFKTNYTTKVRTFNGFIEPSKVKTLTLGYSNIQKKNKLKVSVYRSELTNEIYLYPTTYSNTNIDKSYKYGINIFDKYIISKNLYSSINYSYIIAKIDEEKDENGAYNGKYLPGVSKHNVTINLGYDYDAFSAVLSHTYRSSAFASNDFENNFSQKQDPYTLTDLSLTYAYKQVEFFIKVDNIFDQKNGLWTKDDSIYPTNFERLYSAGLTYNF